MNRNEILFDRAKAIIPGGVNSPVRAFGSVGGVPRFIKKAEGAYVWDENGTRYTDYVGSWGPAIVGHAHPEVIEAVREAALGGLSFGAPTEGEIVIAEEIAKIMPSVERLRLVSSGTEATMTAIRLARGFTGRDKIIKFEGCYHGHSDSLLVKAGSGLLTFGNPSSAGVPADFTKHTLVLEYNNIAQLEEAFARNSDEIACVILEPFVGNMNLVRPTEAFVKALRELTEKHGAVLIYDEVMTGFRVALGGAQSLHGITPDLTTMGKVIGGGMPLAAFGGRKDIMEEVDKSIFISTTFGGECLSLAAGIAVMKALESGEVTKAIWEKGKYLQDNFRRLAKEIDVPIDLSGYPCRLNLEYTDYEGKKDWLYNSIFMQESVKRGVLLGWHIFPCYSHTQEDLDFTLNVFEDAMKVYREALKSGHPEKYMEGQPLKIVLG